MGFRENLKQELEFNGMLVKELASAAKVHKRAMDTYLLSEKASIPPVDAAVRIAKVLGVTAEYLVTGEEPTLPSDIRLIIQRLQRLNKKDRQIVSKLIDALIDK
ncbi:MAG: helix-turn-helix domain-containing protein [Treponema sp.]|nr:helix-turn-helix domain-containing protein [Treponema sp.]